MDIWKKGREEGRRKVWSLGRKDDVLRLKD